MGIYTINTTAGEDTKLQTAAGNALNLGGLANGPQTRAWVASLIVRGVQEQLDDIKRKTISYDAPVNPTVT